MEITKIVQEYLTLLNGFNAPSKIEGCPNIEPAKSPKITMAEVNKAACDNIKSSTTIEAKLFKNAYHALCSLDLSDPNWCL